MLITDTPQAWEALLELPLEQRVASAPAELIEFIAAHNCATGSQSAPAPAVADDSLWQDLRAALNGMPAAVVRCIAPRLAGVFLVRDIGSAAVTGIVASPGGLAVGAFVAVDATVFADTTANRWFSWRENTPFAPQAGVRIDAELADAADDDRIRALQFVLLHEFGHVLAACSEYVPDWWRAPDAADLQRAHPYLDLDWALHADGSIAARPESDFPLRQHVHYYSTPALSAQDALECYRQLDTTGFPSLYAATSVHEDFADSFAVYVHTVVMERPYRQRIWHGEALVHERSGFPASPRAAARSTIFAALLDGPAHSMSRVPKDLASVAERARTHYTGLAPVLRMSINGGDLRALAQLLLDAASRDQDNANLWMNLSTAMFALKLQGPGTAVQQQALAMRRTYTRVSSQPTRFRLLMLMAPGNLAENTPLDCLLEDSPVELICHFVAPDALFPEPLPEHDALLVAFSDSAVNSPLLERLVPILDQWHRPVINRPGFIANTERSRASHLLQDVPGLAMPLTWPLPRSAVEDAARANATHCGPAPFPIIVRPVGSQAGQDLDRIPDAQALAAYLERVPAQELYVSPFIDYSGADGQFRKIRVALVDGVPYVSHMAVSSHWMVHYLNAGMYEDAAKRREEEAFMDRFDGFVQRHAVALRAIHERSGLDYLCIDCAETRGGDLLIFEIDHVMVVHAMDSLELFPFKHVHMAKLRHAFEDYLYRLRPAATTREPS